MQGAEATQAVEAATSVAIELGLTVHDAIVLHNSNKLTLRLVPCDVVARVAHRGQEALQFEVDIALRLAVVGSPVAALDRRVAPRAYERDGLVLTLWTYYEPRESSPAAYADALAHLHTGMRTLDVATPHFTDRVEEAQQLVARRDLTPLLAEADRELLSDILERQTRGIRDRGAAEQVLHGEPHPGNLLSAPNGLVFIDFETCCRGPVEFDLAHVPESVSAYYPGTDEQLLSECRLLVLAMVAAWRWDATDQFPDGRREGERLISVLRNGPPWPTLDAGMPPRV